VKKFFLFLCLGFCSLRALIIEVSSIAAMDQYKEDGVLFLYDIDNTLVKLTQMLGSDQWFYHRYQTLVNEMDSKQEALDKALAEWTSIQYISKIHEVEEGSSAIIKAQQKQGVTLIGFTTRGLALSRCTTRQLKSIGIDFSHTAPTKDDMFFRNTQSIIFREGVLFTSGTHKGKTLCTFLEKLNIKPSKIVFINDKATHLSQVEEACEEMGIPFIGLRYNYLDEEVARFDSKIADKQFERFCKIMTDDEAAL
jgi:histidinol phosphatase-like enzyme